MILIGIRALRNRGQLSLDARFNVREPRLPPVINSVNGPPALGGVRKNSSRIGTPVSSTCPGGNQRFVASKPTSARYTNEANLRFVTPGTAFGSITISGTRRSTAA